MKFRVPTTGQVEKVYIVEADDSKQAHARVRAYIDDPLMLAQGVVVPQEAETRYKTGEQVQGASIAEATGPQAVDSAKAS